MLIGRKREEKREDGGRVQGGHLKKERDCVLV